MNTIPILIISLIISLSLYVLNGIMFYYLGKKEGKKEVGSHILTTNRKPNKIKIIKVSKKDVEKCRKQQLKRLKEMNKITYTK